MVLMLIHRVVALVHTIMVILTFMVIMMVNTAVVLWSFLLTVLLLMLKLLAALTPIIVSYDVLCPFVRVL